MTHLEKIEKAIEAAQSEYVSCNAELTAANNAIHRAIAEGKNEAAVEKLQVARDEVARRLERCRFAIENLENQKRPAARQDAQEKLPQLVARLTEHVRALNEVYANFSSVVDVLEKAAQQLEATQQKAKDFDFLREEVEGLCKAHNFPLPSIPGLPSFPHKETAQNWASPGRLVALLKHLANNGAVWKPRMTKAERDWLAGIGPKPKAAA